MSKFEVISKYKDKNISLPERKTKYSAGYDIAVAEDTLVPPISFLTTDIELLEGENLDEPHTLDEAALSIKQADAKMTLVPTGLKCQLEENTYLELVARSSLPLKHWLVIPNSVGIIDADYYNNEDNEGHIYFQVLNLAPFPIILKKGDIIGQGIIKPYLKVDDDNADGIRVGGMGSTSK